jgi:hypothetical protein
MKKFILICLIISSSLVLLYSQERIFDIVYFGEYEKLVAVETRINDFHIKTGEGDSLLIVCLKGYLLRKRSGAGTTPLHIAATNGDTETVELLINSGANVSHWDENDNTALMLALQNGHTQTADKIRSYENPQRGDQVEENYARTVEFLLKKNLPVNSKDASGKSLLMYAVESDSYLIAKLLVENGADIRYTKSNNSANALHTAVKRNQLELVKLLVKDKETVNAVWNQDGQSASVPVSNPISNEYKKPGAYNFRLSIYSDRSDPKTDRRCYYKIYVNKVDSGRTDTGLESQKKIFTSMLEPNKHLIQVVKYVLDEKDERYVKLNNIYQPRPGYIYVDTYSDRIVELSIQHNTNKNSVYNVQFIKER